ncbi:C69 family dipeptidase [Microbulbifer elongatus]|uniref:C69 family dipeptidase n=1 Tax=Microbulbifer elongatus TaxID=86173 RepID=UPI001CFC5F68|nr:C69 family dipeptidase [Microbulbifer elongatus]
MCDTLVLRGAKATWLAKNSDRDPLEAQRVEIIPAVKGDGAKHLRCTWIEIPQVPDRHACIIGRPAWMWGAEMGVNECGVAIGNEAIFSREVRNSGAALLGMDLVRLALERADSADNALQVIVDLLQQFGQGGPAGYTQKEFRYDNSFLIADQRVVWKVETAGRHWVAEKIETFDSISNALTINDSYQRSDEALALERINFRNKFDTWLKPFFGASHKRRACSLAQLRQLDTSAVGFADFARILRSHRRGKARANGDLCMHAAPSSSLVKFLRPSHTVNSMIVRIDGDGPRVAFTGTASPCASLFKPVGFFGCWSACAADLWEKHRVWLDHKEPSGKDREHLKASIREAERDIFAMLESDRLEVSEQYAVQGAAKIYGGAGPDCPHPGVPLYGA